MFKGKLCLAPMVRAGELPTRLLALKNNCDLVWSPELVDKKLLQTNRLINEKLNSIDYILPNGNIVFRTIPKLEAGKLILQIGSADPDLAVQAASKVINDVDGIDLNAGCPKHFSIHSGMGAALLSTPELLCSILENLVKKVGVPNKKPISAKIRLLPEQKDTIDLIEKLCNTGITNLTVHCRTREMRNRESPIRDYLIDIYKMCKKHDVSLIINGDLQTRSNFLEVRDQCGLPEEVGGMIADAAEVNPTVFNCNGPNEKWWAIMDEYIKLATQWENNFGNTKYMLSRIIPGKSPVFQIILRCHDYEQIKYVQTKLINPESGTLLRDPKDFIESLQNKGKKDNKNKKKKRSANGINMTSRDTKTTTKKVKI
ncbi:tRNA-dihydrouridine(20) synthase (NAD(+)) PWA37_000501 [Arxiozyma heterogenica]|uniref:DUS-like FMN-binding domain-containing protein n=1 Tax=Arxiozyma heterogenica TaxID=278026 RepID=A0AAN8A700_9SACH|nr:hypothetical protein RI543_003915 [Kazachstania heterogenica]